MKLCPKCQTLKSPEEFGKEKAKKDGLKCICKVCTFQYNAEYYNKNADREKENKRITYSENPELVLARNRSYYSNNSEDIKIKKRIYKKNNRGIYNSAEAKRHAAKLERTPKWLTEEHLLQIEEFYVLAKELQWLSDPTDPLQVDHIVPLQGDDVSGLHVPWNLQILPRSLNCSKGNK